MIRIRRRRSGALGLALSLTALLAFVYLPAAQASHRGITLTGTVLPADGPKDLDTYTLEFGGQKWLFRVTEVNIQRTHSGYSNGRSVLRLMGPQRMKLLGSESTIGSESASL